MASLECELIDRKIWQTKTEARLALFTWIEGWNNPRRRHSALSYLSPMAYETRHANPSLPRGEHGLPTVGACVACATQAVDRPAPPPSKGLRTSARNRPRKAVNSR